MRLSRLGAPVAGQLEIKAPHSRKLPDALPESTRTQVLMQLACQPSPHQLAFSDIIYWTPTGSKIWRVTWDDASQRQWLRIQVKLQHFYNR